VSAAPQLNVSGDEARPDLAARGEIKYGFRRHDVATLRATLRRVADPIVYADPVSTVRSVYFDDARLSACHANLAGLGVRHKLRLRWYDAPSPVGDCYCEIKWRRNQATGKHRFRIAAGHGLLDAPLRQWPRAFAAAVPAALAGPCLRADQPVVLVEYRREHFALDDARLTLDYDLRFYPLMGRRAFARRFAERLGGFALIECKAPLGSGRRAQRALRPLGERAMRFSKYVTGCQRLGYVAEL